MTEDKEAISLSRVYTILERISKLSCTQSVGDLFHTLMVLSEKEYFLTHNLLCYFTSVNVCPMVILPALILKKKK